MAQTYAEALTDYAAARTALLAARTALVTARVQLHNADAVLDTLDPGDGGFRVAAAASRNRLAAFKQAELDLEAAANAAAVALSECRRLA